MRCPGFEAGTRGRNPSSRDTRQRDATHRGRQPVPDPGGRTPQFEFVERGLHEICVAAVVGDAHEHRAVARRMGDD